MFLRTYLGRHGARAALLASCTLGLFLATTAVADSGQPITLGPVTVANGIVSVAGGSDGTSTAALDVTVNGQPASVDANGNITANVDLSGQATLTIAVTNPATGQTTTTTIPVALLGPDGAIPASALDALRQAGVTLDVPPGGFQSIAGHPVQVSGSVADKSTLASLTVNGVDALSLVNPDGSFQLPIPATDKTVTVTAIDKQGASESSRSQITPETSHQSGQTTTATAGSVAAASATGVSITSVRYTTKSVRTSKRIVVSLTVRDKRGLLIRGAKVRIRAASFEHDFVLGTQAAKTTNPNGVVSFTLKLRVAKFNRPERLFTVATALTPSAQTTRTTSVRLPRLTAKRKH
jgi:hypothetical protein